MMMKHVVLGLTFAITDDASCKHTKKPSIKLNAESIRMKTVRENRAKFRSIDNLQFAR